MLYNVPSIIVIRSVPGEVLAKILTTLSWILVRLGLATNSGLSPDTFRHLSYLAELGNAQELARTSHASKFSVHEVFAGS